jgi:site-specific DNA recombinase
VNIIGNWCYAYYFCNQKSCGQYRRSIRKEDIEDAFEPLVKSLRPLPPLYHAAREMLEDLWADRARHVKQQGDAARSELQLTQRKIDQVMERLLASQSPTLMTAFENQIHKLEEQKARMSAQISKCARPLPSFDDTFQTAMIFLANPCNLWDSGRLEDKRMVLKLAFSTTLAYSSETGFTTAELSLPFKMLNTLKTGGFKMVELSGR